MRIEELLIRNKENKDIAIEYKDEAISFMDWNIWSKEVGDIISEATDCVGNVAIYIPNSIFYAVAYFAILYEKGTIVPIFYGSTEFEIENTMRFCECDVILTISDEKNKILSALKNYEYSTTVIFVDLMSFVNVLGNYGIITKTNYFVNSGESEDIAILLHTSGSIASPKRVMLTHTNIINNVIANIESLEMSKNDIGLIALPLVFGYCNTAQFLTHLYLGAKIVIMDGFFFPKTFCELVCSKKITNFTAVPTMLIMLLSYRYCRHYMLDSLRFICFGGGTISIGQICEIMNKFPQINFIHTYGQTECSPRVTALLPCDANQKIGSVGRPIPGVEIKICESWDLKETNNQNIVGEIMVKGKNVMKGYYKNQEATRAVKEGEWLYTGDLGYLDEDGYLYLVGRRKNVIISGGMNIYPEEVEGIIREIEGVEKVCIKGIQDEQLGELSVAYIVRENKNLTKEEVMEYCKGKLSKYKIPKTIKFVETISETYNGKIKRGV